MPEPYRVRAINTASASTNKIHDDAVARQLGFGGGLVPGVDVYAYMTHPVAALWGLDWLARGTIDARFVRPVYDGHEVTVEMTEPAFPASGESGPTSTLTLRDEAGDECATATVGLPAAPRADSWNVDRYPTAPLRESPPPAGAEALRAPGPLGSVEGGFWADRSPEYLEEVRETLPLYREERIAHPGWLLRTANHILAVNVVLGPWIHVSSDVTHLGLVRDGDRVSTRGWVTDVFERKGHKFVTLDVLIVTNEETPVMHVGHTAIYEPRQGADA